MPDPMTNPPQTEAERVPEIARLPKWKRMEALAEPPFGWSAGDDEAVTRINRAAFTRAPGTTVSVSVDDLRAICRVARQSQYRYALAEEYRIERDKARKEVRAIESRVREECARRVEGLLADWLAAYPTDVWPSCEVSDAQSAQVLRLMLPRIQSAAAQAVRGEVGGGRGRAASPPERGGNDTGQMVAELVCPMHLCAVVRGCA